MQIQAHQIHRDVLPLAVGTTEPVDTDKDLEHTSQESLIEGLITVQYELRMKRFSLTSGRAQD